MAIAALVTLQFIPFADAQSVTPEQLRALQQRQNQNNDDDGPLKPSVQNYAPTTLPPDLSPSSRLEILYAPRAGKVLTQFGYDSLGVPSSVSIAQSGAIPDSYTLSMNDELIITLRGQENSNYRAHVDRDGRITLPKLNPLLAAGRRFSDFRADLEQQVASAYISTRVFVTLGNIHEITVLVSGEVRSPGTRLLNGLASPLDAILLSGGIKKTGSLRSVRIVNNGTTRTIDLYSVISQSGTMNLGTLRDGDKIYVPPIGATVGVSGAASRNGIYELPAGASAMGAGTLLHLAGGVEIAGSYTLAKMAVQRDGSLSMIPITQGTPVRNGEVLFVTGGRLPKVGVFQLLGSVPQPGYYPLATTRTVRDMFRSIADLKFNAYAPFAVIRRRDVSTNALVLIPFSIAGAIRGNVDIPLQSDDSIYVFSRAEILALANLSTKDLNSAYSPTPYLGKQQGGPNALPSPLPLVAAVDEFGATIEPTQDDTNAINPANPDANASGGQGANGQNGADQVNPTPPPSPFEDLRFRNAHRADNSASAALNQAQAILDRNARLTQARTGLTDERVVDGIVANFHGMTSDALLRMAADNLVWVLDEVREPGPYLAANGTLISDMIQAAGGVQQTADLSEIEVTSTEIDQQNGTTQTSRSIYNQRDGKIALASIRPMDVIRLRPIYSDREQGTVTVAGQVRFPGVFDITRDERLSSLLQRAGGLTEVSYPYGAIFTRRDAALHERDGNERSAREIQNQIPSVVLSQSTGNTDNKAAAAYLESLIKSLRDMPTLGRIVITADPTVLAVKPELDFVLQPGDTLYIPKRPSTVTVSGEVLNSGSFQYRAGLKYSDYIRMAGGVTQSGDRSRTFVVLPDGTAAPTDGSWFSFDGGGNVPPGSTVVVPRDLQPFNWPQFLKDATQIVSQLAVTAASLSVLGKNN